MNKELQKLYEWLCINRLTLNISNILKYLKYLYGPMV